MNNIYRDWANVNTNTERRIVPADNGRLGSMKTASALLTS